MHLHTSCGHLPCGQVGDYVLCNPHSHAKFYHLHSEKRGGVKHHEESVEDKSSLGVQNVNKVMIYIHRDD